MEGNGEIDLDTLREIVEGLFPNGEWLTPPPDSDDLHRFTVVSSGHHEQRGTRPAASWHQQKNGGEGHWSAVWGEFDTRF